MINGKSKILLVEDDLNLGFLLVDFLENEGYEVKLCKDGISGLTHAEKNFYNVCIFDVMMPKMDGYTMAKTLRKKGVVTPFIFLTAKSMKEDILNGYAIGAEDYITKPFDEEELLCKIKVILRRHKTDLLEDAPTQFTIGQYCFDYSRQELTFNGDIQRLTEKENEVLRLLCLHKNKILKRDDALSYIYGKPDYFLGRSFDVYISRLRKLLQRDASIEIQNVFKVGFILQLKEENITV